jgi:hypothetical protein
MYECPYHVGAKYTLLLAPFNAHEHSEDTKALLPVRIRVNVLDTYTFTQSSAMKVAIESSLPEGRSGTKTLPSVAVLKLYDRRYIEERTRKPGIKYWTHEKEVEAMKTGPVASQDEPIQSDVYTFDTVLNDGNQGAVENELNGVERKGEYDESNEDSEIDDLGLEFQLASDDEPIAQWKIEERYRRIVTKWFITEYEAYKLLEPLQGVSIPTFYGTTSFDAETLSEMPPGIITEVKGILIEFIEGQSLDQLHKDSAIIQRFQSIGRSAITCFESIISYGVLHGDVRVANLIVRNPDGRVFLIDFAHAVKRKADEDDDDWQEHVRCEREADAMRDFLFKRGLLVGSI